MELFVEKPWAMFEEGTNELLEFEFFRDGRLLVSRGGVGEWGKWELTPSNNNLVLDYNMSVSRLQSAFLDDRVMLLQKSGSQDPPIAFIDQRKLPELNLYLYLKSRYGDSSEDNNRLQSQKEVNVGSPHPSKNKSEKSDSKEKEIEFPSINIKKWFSDEELTAPFPKPHIPYDSPTLYRTREAEFIFINKRFPDTFSFGKNNLDQYGNVYDGFRFTKNGNAPVSKIKNGKIVSWHFITYMISAKNEKFIALTAENGVLSLGDLFYHIEKISFTTLQTKIAYFYHLGIWSTVQFDSEGVVRKIYVRPNPSS